MLTEVWSIMQGGSYPFGLVVDMGIEEITCKIVGLTTLVGVLTLYEGA
jgi:hypothetical protein